MCQSKRVVITATYIRQKTEEELRIKMAELRGWRKSTYEKENRPGIGNYAVWVSPSGLLFDAYESDESHHLPPLTLDEMNEAEKMLSPEQAVRFRLLLAENSDGPNAEFRTVEAAMCHATKEQRAEAFIAVMENKK